MYQQMKLERKNIVALHLDMVFDTAKRIEEHLMTANARISNLAIDAVIDAATTVISLENEFRGLIQHFIDDVDPLCPEPETLTNKFKLYVSEHETDDEIIMAFTRACGIEDEELTIFIDLVDREYAPHKDRLIGKVIQIVRTHDPDLEIKRLDETSS